MDSLPNNIFQTWVHSFEEDANGVTVYRPAGYAFPPARGRSAIEFKNDGNFVDWSIGAADASSAINGHWHITGSGRVRITFEGGVRPTRELEILECDAGVLKIRE